MTRIGAHVKTGSRDGYGEFCDADPAILVSVGDGGALTESDHAIKIYRTIMYNNHPEGVGLNDPETTQEEAYAIADMFWPLLDEEFEQNPADYYIVINESGANDGSVVKNYVWYEWRMMEHAEEADKKLCLCNLFSGTPDDGSVVGNPPTGGMEHWKAWYGPLLARGYKGGHIYGRHSYGYPHLVPLDHNSDRPFREVDWLRSQGIYIGVALTECGLYGGEYQPGPDEIVEQMAAYDALLQRDPDMFVGAAWWTYGDWNGAGGYVNLERVSPSITAYIASNPSEAWTPMNYVPPTKYKAIVVKAPQEVTAAEWQEIANYSFKYRHDMTASHDTMLAIMGAGNEDSYVKVFEPLRPSQQESIAMLEAEGYKWEAHYLNDVPTEFAYEIWPVALLPHVTQYWAENPEFYGKYCEGSVCLPGHGGVDMRAPTSTRIVSVAPGRVVRVHLGPDNHDFGIHVYVQHDPYNELTGYCHLQSTNLQVGQMVEAGQLIGYANNTGNSFGSHLHFLRKRPGETYTDEHGTWPYNLFDPTKLLKPLAPHLFPDDPPVDPPGTAIDLKPYFTDGQEYGVLYEVQTQISVDGDWGSGPQQRHQTQNELREIFYHTKGGDGPYKNAEWEQLKVDELKIYRSIDTSPSEDQSQYYELYDVPEQKWSVWCDRYMVPGHMFTRYPFVDFRKKSDCSMVSSGRQQSMIVLEVVHDSYKFFTGIELEDVAIMLWTDMAGNPIERYYYAVGYGLVGWEGNNRRAAISEIHEPGARPNSVRETISCL